MRTILFYLINEIFLKYHANWHDSSFIPVLSRGAGVKTLIFRRCSLQSGKPFVIAGNSFFSFEKSSLLFYQPSS